MHVCLHLCTASLLESSRVPNPRTGCVGKRLQTGVHSSAHHLACLGRRSVYRAISLSCSCQAAFEKQKVSDTDQAVQGSIKSAHSVTVSTPSCAHWEAECTSLPISPWVTILHLHRFTDGGREGGRDRQRGRERQRDGEGDYMVIVQTHCGW